MAVDSSGKGQSAAEAEAPKKAENAISKAETHAYWVALLVNFVDQMGPQFTIPVRVTYGQAIGGSLPTIALFTTAQGVAAMSSNVWMPLMSDRFGRKWIAFASTVGVTLGYCIQGSAWYVKGDEPSDWGTGCLCFMLGRFTVGFFSGMQPVLQAYITELSQPDTKLLTQRLVVMNVASNVAGIALAPVAGVLATFGLALPFWICAILGLVSVVTVPLFFKEVSEIKGAQDAKTTADVGESKAATDADAPTGDAKAAPLVEPIDVENGSFSSRDAARSPFCDSVVVLMFWAYFFLMVLVMSGATFLAPVLLELPSFGITGDTPLEFKQNVSKWVGVTSIPLGLFQIIMAIALFTPVTRKYGEVPVICTMGAIATCLFPLMGLWANRLWKVALLNVGFGVTFGFIAPALGPVMARYSSAIYPKRMALVQGIPLVGLQLSNTFSQNMMAAVVGGDEEHPRIRLAYCACAGVCAIFVVLFAAAANLAQRRITSHTAAPAGSPILSAPERFFSSSSRPGDEDQFTVAALKRTPASIGHGDFAPSPFATPVLRRAFSEQKKPQHRRES